jgi:ssDNA thymidine ADP-ribosyltransferase, DarT
VEQYFPWELVDRIGVIDTETERHVSGILASAGHKPAVVVASNPYYEKKAR